MAKQYEILPAIPKRSTTSRCTTGSGGITPERSDDATRRRKLQVQLSAPTPQQLNAQRWEQWENDWKERLRRADEEEQRKQAALRATDKKRQEANEREIARLRRVKEFKVNEALIEGIIKSHCLSPTERSVVMQRLVDSGNPHNCDIAEIACQEIVLNRGKKPPPQSELLDWRPDRKMLEHKHAPLK
jgi:hypothetical protein